MWNIQSWLWAIGNHSSQGTERTFEVLSKMGDGKERDFVVRRRRWDEARKIARYPTFSDRQMTCDRLGSDFIGWTWKDIARKLRPLECSFHLRDL